MVDFDKLMEQARRTKDTEDDFELWRKIFELEHWILVAKDRGKATRPFIAVIDGVPTIPFFTDPQKALEFSHRNRISKEGEEALIITISPSKAPGWARDLMARGVVNLTINDSWTLPLCDLGDLYFYLVEPYDFRELVRRSEEEDDLDGIRDLWTAAFDLPKWFFIGDMRGEKGKMLLIPRGRDMVFQAFVSHQAAQEALEKLGNDPRFEGFEIVYYEPKEAVQFMESLAGRPGGAFSFGIQLHGRDGVNFGVRLEKLRRIMAYFKL